MVIGSSNTDMIIKSDRIPSPGETILGGKFQMMPGGKGANQAVAIARLGGRVSFVSRVGKDWLGDETKAQLETVGVDLTHFHQDESESSGVALIMVSREGSNCISVAPGANALLSEIDISAASDEIGAAELLLTQLEVPLSTVQSAVSLAQEKGVTVVLNPAPAQKLPSSLLKNIDILTPNESEAKILTGIEVHDEPSAHEAALRLRESGVASVVITMGSSGAYVSSREWEGMVTTRSVDRVIDTTGAGDIFNGAMALGLTKGMSLQQAVSFANEAGSYSVTKMGAQSSAPSREDLQKIR